MAASLQYRVASPHILNDDMDMTSRQSSREGSPGRDLYRQASERTLPLLAAEQAEAPLLSWLRDDAPSAGSPRRPLKGRRRRGWVRLGIVQLPMPIFLLFSTTAVLLFVTAIFGAKARYVRPLPLLSNGTHLFHPTTLIISIDGFRADYLETYSGLVPNLLGLANSDAGLRAQSMMPAFPTLTFPNHWSLLTGLHPESHGIIANEFYAPDLDGVFNYARPNSLNAEWWLGEPMWSVAERGGRKAVNIMWPGPPSTRDHIAPSYFVQYKDNTPSDKLATTLHYLDRGLDERPSLLLTYIPDVDQAGHKSGPDSEGVKDALRRVDDFIGHAQKSLADRNLTHVVDLIVISDHGMAATSKDRLVFLDDILGDGFADLEYRDGWPAFGLRFREGSPTDDYLARLRKAAQESNGSFDVYTHETMPDRWHFNTSARIAPIYLVPNLGWVITDHEEYRRYSDEDGTVNPKGCHGFDNRYAEMQAIFFAHGPAALRMKKKAVAQPVSGHGWVSTKPAVMDSFRNLELFNLVMRLQGLQSIAPPNNGSTGFWDAYL